MNVKTPDYGIDAPGVRKGMPTAGGIGLILALAIFTAGRNWDGLLKRVTDLVGGGSYRPESLAGVRPQD